MNVMKAIAKGCWLLADTWVFSSLEKGEWAAEEEHACAFFGENNGKGDSLKRATVLDKMKVYVQDDPEKENLEFLVVHLGGKVY